MKESVNESVYKFLVVNKTGEIESAGSTLDGRNGAKGQNRRKGRNADSPVEKGQWQTNGKNAWIYLKQVVLSGKMQWSCRTRPRAQQRYRYPKKYGEKQNEMEGDNFKPHPIWQMARFYAPTHIKTIFVWRKWVTPIITLKVKSRELQNSQPKVWVLKRRVSKGRWWSRFLDRQKYVGW